MKNLLLAFLIFTTCRPAFAQGTFPFPTDSAEWIVHKVYGIIGPTDYFQCYRDFVSGQDSLFEGNVYTIAWRQSLCQCTCTSPGYLPEGSQVPYRLGGIREENGKVYFTVFGGDGTTYFRPVHDTLLYDFTVEAGDTIPYGQNKELVITEVEMAHDGRKIIRFDIHPPGYPRIWIEGRGSEGLLETTEWFNMNFNIPSCFSAVLPSVCTYPCEVATSTFDPGGRFHALNVRPSLAADQITVDWPDSWPTADVRMFAVDGRLLASFNGVLPGQLIDVSALPAGVIHVVCAGDNKRSATGRFVKF